MIKNAVDQPKDRWIAFAILSAVYGVNLADRILMSVLAEPIKIQFQLSDSALSFATGTIFAIFYLSASIPLGVLCDKMNRRYFLTSCGVLFSVMTVLTGLAENYMLLLLARIGVGIGEAGITTGCVSLLSDKFAPERRPAVMTLFTLGGSLGAWIGSAGGGYFGTQIGWRMTMCLFGLGSLTVIVLSFLIAREPKRGALDGAIAAQSSGAGFRQAMAECVARRSVLHTLIGSIVVSLWLWGLIWWGPPYLDRSFGITLEQSGALFGQIHVIGGTISVVLTSLIMSFMARSGPRVPLHFLVVLGALTSLPSIMLVLTHSSSTVTLLFWLISPMAFIYTGLSFATVTTVMSADHRGQAVSVLNATNNFAVMAIAPQLVGAVSDLVRSHLVQPTESLRYALIVLAVMGPWATYHFWMSARRVTVDVASATDAAH